MILVLGLGNILTDWLDAALRWFSSWFGFDFARPGYLALIILIVPVVYLWQTSKVPASPFRRWTSLVLRVALVLALILALAGTRVVWNNKGVCVVFVLDQSQSIPQYVREALREKLGEEVQKMGKDDLFVVVEFGGDAVLASLPSKKGALPPPAKVNDPGRTDIARALRLAMASFPADRQKRIVLLSDGNQNTGDAIREARVAAANDVDISTLLAKGPTGHEVMVEQVILPPRAAKDARFVARAIISADQAQGAQLMITRDGKALPSQKVQLKAGTNVFDIPDSLAEGGMHEYQVTVVPDRADADTFSANNTGHALMQIDAPGKVLVIRGRDTDPDYIAEALRQNKMTVDSGTTGMLPSDARGLMPYDCIVLQNVPVIARGGDTRITPVQIDALERWVREQGGGLVLVGGDDSFGPGGYKDTGLERVSPVEMDVKRKKHLATVAMAIMLDKSGSMGMPVLGVGLTKMDLANQGSVETLKLLGPADEVQIGAVDAEVHWMTANHLVPATDPNKAALRKNTLSTRAGGDGIYTKTALAHAYRLVTAKNVEAMARHVVLFADVEDTEQQEDCIEMATKYYKSHQVTISVIGLGPKDGPHIPFQKALAAAGHGRAYQTDDAMALPRIFAKEAFIAARSAFVEKKEGIPPTLYESPLLRGIRDAGVPRVYGYVGTTLKPRATLAAHGLEQDDPLVAHWVIGLGKCVAYTSDATNHWGKDWVGWGGFAKFWAQTVQWATKSVQNQQLATTATIEGKRGRVTVEAFGTDGRPINNLQLRAAVTPPDTNDTAANAPLVQVGPGRYEGEFAASPLGIYQVSVVDEKSSAPVDYAGAVLSYPPEFRDLSPNAALLRSLAQITGGQELVGLEGVFTPKDKPVRTYWPLWAPLLLFGAIGLLLDVAWRRLNIADWFRREAQPMVAMGQGMALGALKTIRTGKRQVEAQREQLRERAGSAPPAPTLQQQLAAAETAVVTPPIAGLSTAAVEAPNPSASSSDSGTAPQAPSEGYSNRLLGAKRRAAEQMKEKEEKH